MTTYNAHLWQTGDTISADLLNANEQGTAAAYDRGNHSGTQPASTVSGLAAVATSGAYSDLSGAPALATVATTGAYGDLSGRPNLQTVATSGSYADLTSKPSFAPVATSGAYTDLSGKPTLATVATSGSFADLSNVNVSVAQLPAGTTLTVLKDGTTGWPARPTARTDIVVAWKGADPSPSVVSSGTGGMLNNIDYRLVTS